MRPIDADELRELFGEVISGIAKKPEMTGALEHMVRASAMTIKMIDDMPTINVNEWTSVKDDLPEEDGEYMVAWLPVGYNIPTDRKCALGDFEFEAGKWLEPLDVQRMYPRGVKVYAWAELPEQYELREEDMK